MSATESLDRRAEVTPLHALGVALGACAGAPDALAPEVSRIWAAAGRTLLELALDPLAAGPEAVLLLLDAAGDSLAPPWLIVDGLTALIVEHLALEAPPQVVVSVDRSLAGLRQLSGRLRRPTEGSR